MRDDWRGDSESDALSQASSSPHSVAEKRWERFMPMWGRAGGERGVIVDVEDDEEQFEEEVPTWRV